MITKIVDLFLTQLSTVRLQRVPSQHGLAVVPIIRVDEVLLLVGLEICIFSLFIHEESKQKRLNVFR